MSERMKRRPYKDITVKNQFADCRDFMDFHTTHVQQQFALHSFTKCAHADVLYYAHQSICAPVHTFQVAN